MIAWIILSYPKLFCWLCGAYCPINEDGYDGLLKKINFVLLLYFSLQDDETIGSKNYSFWSHGSSLFLRLLQSWRSNGLPIPHVGSKSAHYTLDGLGKLSVQSSQLRPEVQKSPVVLAGFCDGARCIKDPCPLFRVLHALKEHVSRWLFMLHDSPYIVNYL